MRLLPLATFGGVVLAGGIVLLSGEKPAALPAASPVGDTSTISPAQAASPEILSNLDAESATSTAPRRPDRKHARSRHSPQAIGATSQHRDSLRRTFFRLARLDRALAVDLALRLPSSADQTLALESIARQFARTHASVTASLAPDSASRGQSLANLLVRGNLPPQLVLRIAARHHTDSPAAAIASKLLSREARSNPARAIAMSRLLPDSVAASAAVATGWAQTAPRAALGWARTLDTPDLRAAALSDVALTLATRDAAFAADIVAEIPTPQRSEPLLGVANIWAGVDTAAAMSWAASLPDSAQSQAALAAIRQVAPTGVGIALRDSRDSPYPAAAQLVPDSPAAKSGAIRAGDAIVAVGDGSGSWNSTSGQNLQSIVEWIRGESGRDVHLQILPAGNTAPANLRTVTLTREQLLFKRPQPGLPNEG